jgi:hypothetical protein
MLAKDRQIRPRWDECSSGGLLRRAGYAGGGGVSFEPPSAFRGAARVFQLFCSNWASARHGSNVQPPDSKSGAQYHCEWFRMLIVLLLAPIRSASAAKSVLQASATTDTDLKSRIVKVQTTLVAGP